MTYRCGMCRKTYTSFDAVRLLSFTDHKCGRGRPVTTTPLTRTETFPL